MQKKQTVFIISITVAVALVLSFFVGFTINSVNSRVTQYCFGELANASEHLAEDLYNTVDMDRTILTAMAAIIGSNEALDNAGLCDIMKAYNLTSSYVSYVELLRPDNTLLGADGTIREVSGSFDFARDAKIAPYISDISYSTLDPKERVLRNAVPVVRNGKTIYILYGVVRLSDFAQKYRTNIYEGHAYVYLLDSKTGDFLLDTWHKTPGNVKEIGKRKMLEGYSFDTAMTDMKNGFGGNLGFVSKTTGTVLYAHYEPVGINGWSVMVSVEQKYALSENQSISSSLYSMAGIIAIVMLLYMACITFSLFKAYRQMKRLGNEDQITHLKNRNAFENYLALSRNKTFPLIVCIYADVNGLHEVNNKYGHAVGDEMLCIVAEELKREFDYDNIYRIGGDEFVVLCDNMSVEACRAQINRAADAIKKKNYSIAFGFVAKTDEIGLDDIITQADEEMLKNKQAYYEENDINTR